MSLKVPSKGKDSIDNTPIIAQENNNIIENIDYYLQQRRKKSLFEMEEENIINKVTLNND